MLINENSPVNRVEFSLDPNLVDPADYPKTPTILRVPFMVNVADTSPKVLNKLLDKIASTLGTEYFREKSLFLEVLNDRAHKAKDKSKHLDGPYVAVLQKDNGVLRMTTTDAPEGGFTVYDQGMLNNLLGAVIKDEPITEDSRPAARPRG